MLPEIAAELRLLGHGVVTFIDEISTTQDENLQTIVDFHNSQTRNLDVSLHFNAYVPTAGGRGTEVLYLTQQSLAERIASAISESGGLINRGAHKRSDLYFLNGTTEPAVLLEIAFTDALADCTAYQTNFGNICRAIADVAAPVATQTLRAKGKCSWFGGPTDMGVSPSEGLAFIYAYEEKPQLFLPQQPPGTTGLARRLNSEAVNCIAMRWDYNIYPKEFLRGDVVAKIRAPKTGRTTWASPADWGPHVDTSRIADLSLACMSELGIETDDEVEVLFPAGPH